MPRRPSLTIQSTPKGFKLEVPATLSASGRRERFFYQNEKQAKKHAASMRKRYHELGTKAGTIGPTLAEQAVRAEELLEPLGVSLLDAIRDYVNRHSNAGAGKTVEEAWSEYEEKLVRERAAPDTKKDYKRDRRKLPKWFLELKVGVVKDTHLEKALDEVTSKRGPSWNRKLRCCRAVLREALRDDLRPTAVVKRDPAIINADTAAKIMELALAEGCALPFALMMFAGIRPTGELSRLTRTAIRENHIFVSSEDSKTREERDVPISPNLRAWIDHCDGESIDINDNKAYRRVRKAAGISAHQDILRHSFASGFYQLHDVDKTIRAMGHTSFNTTKKFYLRAVTPEQAEAYFNVMPPQKES
jgi:integrase